jgi:hypothetical protein
MVSLRTQLGRVRRRLLGIGITAAAVWALAAATTFLLLGVWLDLLWEFSPQWRIATFWAAGVSGAALLAALAAMTLRTARDAAVARRLDRAGDGGGRILTGWELALGRYGVRGAQPAPLSAGLASLAVADAVAAAGRVPRGKVAPVRPVGRSLAALCVLWGAVALAAVCLPGLAGTQWSRFLRPWDDVPPFSRSKFAVQPGNVKVLYGGELEIRATVTGEPVDQLELVLQSANSREPPLPMFPEADGSWRTVLAKVVDPADYFVRAHRARSIRYHIDIITVPLIEGVRLRIVPPEYANRATYEGPMPNSGISGLPATKVQVFVRSNRSLRGGTLALSGPGKPVVLPMKPVETGGQEVVGQFSIAGDGKFQCRVIDDAGQPSQQSFSGNVVMLADERPLVRITQPQKMSLATPNAVLPVTLSAEDDCGLSRLQLFRSLNDSRPLPADLSLPSRPPLRIDASVRLPLDHYGLEPGDVIKLFGRAEDNDPAGAKGAESSVVTVRIISQEEFDRLVRTREGIQAMLSKYYAARRRMESLAEKAEGLRKKLTKLSPGGKLSAETRQELHHLQRLLRREAGAMRKSAGHSLPFDLDRHLAPELNSLVKLTDEMADTLEKLEKEKDLINKKLSGKLDELAKRLAAGRREFAQQAAEPLEYLEAIFPLLADQSRFVMLALWQEDFAQRLTSLRGQEGKDDPATKARMRDLEQEQGQIREALAKLLDDIQEHSEGLPEKPELKTLRRTAQEFVKDVRASGAAEAMAAAEAALGEFAPTRAHKKAKEAADLLAKFVNRCEGSGGMGDLAYRGLRFQPILARGLGNTIAQLLAQLGMGGGDGGMIGGEGAVGLYGGLPDMFGDAGEYGDAQGGGAERWAGLHGQPRGENPDAARRGQMFAPGAAGGVSEGAIPARYRRQVGQYFQRIAEETEESAH